MTETIEPNWQIGDWIIVKEEKKKEFLKKGYGSFYISYLSTPQQITMVSPNIPGIPNPRTPAELNLLVGKRNMVVDANEIRPATKQEVNKYKLKSLFKHATS